MRGFYFLVLAALLCVGFGLLVSCDDDDDDDLRNAGDDDEAGVGGGNDDDNDSGGGDDDDNDSGGGDDDDDVSGDTWTDPATGLTWQVELWSDYSTWYMTWERAITYCEELSLAGGGWRLPTISELRTLIRGCDGTVTGGSCGITDDCVDTSCSNHSCYSCHQGDGPNNGCYGLPELPDECLWYWSSTQVADNDIYVWHINLITGGIYYDTVGNYDEVRARCVRP